VSHYFDRFEADPSDKELQLAKKKGVVPDGCRLHGALVLGIHETGGDPCAECGADRDVCGGRPAAKNREGAGLPPTDDAARRRLTRLRQAKQTLELFGGD